MSYILSGDAAVFYEEYGAGEPLVLLPGLLGTVESHWRRFLPDFARRFHTIAVDLRGHGKTNNPSRILRLSQFVDDLHKLLDTLQLDRPLLCGYSFGGYLALAYATRHGAKIRGMALHATKFFWDDDAVRAVAGDMDPETVSATSHERAAALQQDHLPGNGPGGWRELLNASRSFLATLPAEGPGEPALSAVRCPVLVSHCEADVMIPHAEAKRLAAALPAGRLHLFGGCGHPIGGLPKQPFVEVTTEFLLSCLSRAAG